MSFTVAIVGRPNVGKSTLFNRLTGTRHALVDDTPGVTRDRREGEGNVGPLHFRVFDTAGLEHAAEDSLAARMTQQSLAALQQADVVLLVVDGRAGITPTDEDFADIVRKSGRPVVLVVNKAEGGRAQPTLLESYRLGLGEPVGISAEHGEGMVELYEALEPFATEQAEEISPEGTADSSAEEEDVEEEKPRGPLHIAIVGRPNAGKSTLVNALLKEERVLTGPEAGITRDAISVPFFWKGEEMRLVDTAGMRKKANVQHKLEKLSVSETLRAIQYAQVVVLMIDATLGLEKQDSTIAALVEREGRAMILCLNKWDLVEDKTKRMKEIEYALEGALQQVKGIPVVPVSALKGKGLDKIMQAALNAVELWSSRIPTAQLNRWLEAALERHAPPQIDGRRLKIRYMTQAKGRPPTFVLASNMAEIPDHYGRYLLNGLRDTFKLPGIPLRLKVKKGKNPYEEKN